ncbi:MAG: phytanoyl-CoA dioxygenase family protein [Caulobacterales bacterium]
MTSTSTTLSPAEIQQFNDHGYVFVRGAFASDDALAMQDEWWAELTATHGVRRGERATWRQPRGDLKQAKKSPIQAMMATAKVLGVIDDLLGAGAWPMPRHWGRVLTTFPEAGDWFLPTELWHSDSPPDWHRDALNGVFVASFIGEVAPGGGGTLIVSGSHRLLKEHDASLTPDERRSAIRQRIERFYRSHPWLMMLSGRAPSPPDRIGAFMDVATEVGGVPARVVELTGEPGDMVFAHPTIVHSVAPNRGTQPRFMRIAQVITHRCLAYRTGKARPPA